MQDRSDSFVIYGVHNFASRWVLMDGRLLILSVH